MVTAEELLPGDLVVQGDMSAVFISLGSHPVWPGLALVIWRAGEEWSLDALHFHQEVGEVVFSTSRQRAERLYAAFGHSVPLTGTEH